MTGPTLLGEDSPDIFGNFLINVIFYILDFFLFNKSYDNCLFFISSVFSNPNAYTESNCFGAIVYFPIN